LFVSPSNSHNSRRPRLPLLISQAVDQTRILDPCVVRRESSRYWTRSTESPSITTVSRHPLAFRLLVQFNFPTVSQHMFSSHGPPLLSSHHRSSLIARSHCASMRGPNAVAGHMLELNPKIFVGFSFAVKLPCLSVARSRSLVSPLLRWNDTRRIGPVNRGGGVQSPSGQRKTVFPCVNVVKG
jgi:hypothetical protein